MIPVILYAKNLFIYLQWPDFIRVAKIKIGKEIKSEPVLLTAKTEIMRGIVWDHLCVAICIPQPQFLAKNFTVIKSSFSHNHHTRNQAL